MGVLGELVAKTQHDPSPEQRLSARTAAVPGGLALLHLSQLAPLVRAKANPGPSRTVAHHHGPASGLGRGGVPPSAHTTTILAEEAAPVTGDPSEGPLTPPIEQRDELRRARERPAPALQCDGSCRHWPTVPRDVDALQPARVPPNPGRSAPTARNIPCAAPWLPVRKLAATLEAPLPPRRTAGSTAKNRR